MDPIRTLAELVAIPSVNPMGREVLDLGSPYYESRLTDYLEQVCRRMGLRVFRQPVAPGGRTCWPGSTARSRRNEAAG